MSIDPGASSGIHTRGRRVLCIGVEFIGRTRRYNGADAGSYVV